MDVITSVTNEKVKYIRSLKDKKVRKTENKFLVEGANIVKDIPEGVSYDLISTVTNVDIVHSLKGKPDSILWVSEKVMESLSDTVTPAGMIAVVPTPKCEFDAAANAVVMDGVSDPGNVGTILRICAACDIRQVVAYGDTADCYSPKVVRASMGGILHTSILRIKDGEMSMLDAHEFLALDMNGENVFSNEFRLNGKRPFALAVGSEAHGISSYVRGRADRILSIPMSDKMESLNAGVSLGVALYRILNL